MRCSHNCQQCACTASNAHVRLQAIEYLNISGLVIDFATSPVRTGNSFFAVSCYWRHSYGSFVPNTYVSTCCNYWIYFTSLTLTYSNKYLQKRWWPSTEICAVAVYHQSATQITSGTVHQICTSSLDITLIIGSIVNKQHRNTGSILLSSQPQTPTNDCAGTPSAGHTAVTILKFDPRSKCHCRPVPYYGNCMERCTASWRARPQSSEASRSPRK